MMRRLEATMRAAIIFALALCGCGGDNNTNSTHDMAMTLDLTTTADFSLPSTCDVVKQTGCMTGQKCVPSFSASGKTSGACVANGTVAEGASCQPTNDQNLDNDDCKAGLACDVVADLSSSTFACRKYCNADSDCTTSGQKCAGFVINSDVSYGVCLPTCTPFTTGACPAGSDCSVAFNDTSFTQSNNTGFYVCKTTGTTALYAPCMDNFDCAADLECDFNNGWCSQNCDATHQCTQPPATDGGPSSVSCIQFTNQPNMEGFCG